MSRTSSHFRWPGMALACMLLVLSGWGAKEPKPPKQPISLEIENTDPAGLPTQVLDGWSLPIRLWANDEMGIGREQVIVSWFPMTGDTAWIWWEDPDYDPSTFPPTECFSWVPPSCLDFPACTQWDACEFNETSIEFTPDTDQAGVIDGVGNYLQGLRLTETGGGGSPKVFVYNKNTDDNDFLRRIGPYTGPETDPLAYQCVGPYVKHPQSCTLDSDCALLGPNSVCREVPAETDGRGWGADDDNMSLVVLPDTGAGIVVDELFNRPSPMQVRNAAGHTTSVSWELNDVTVRSSIFANLVVPLSLFNEVILRDDCVYDPDNGDDPSCRCDSDLVPVCTGSSRFRIDGGPILSEDDIGMTLGEYLDTLVTTIRVVVVNRQAPDVVSDMNGDSMVTADDLELMGYELLSGEEVIRVRFLREQLFDGAFDYDFDGNGLGLKVAPVGPGGTKEVPR